LPLNTLSLLPPYTVIAATGYANTAVGLVYDTWSLPASQVANINWLFGPRYLPEGIGQRLSYADRHCCHCRHAITLALSPYTLPRYYAWLPPACRH